MQDSRRLRRIELIKAISRQPRVLFALKYEGDRAKAAIKDNFASQIQAFTNELEKMEAEFLQKMSGMTPRMVE